MIYYGKRISNTLCVFNVFWYFFFVIVVINIFVLLSGYFSATKVIYIDKIKKIYIQVWTYSIMIAVVLFWNIVDK